MSEPTTSRAVSPPHQDFFGIPLWLIVLAAPVWVPLWAVLCTVMFIVGVCRYLVLDRALRAMMGPEFLGHVSGPAYILLLFGCVLLAPFVLLTLLAWGTIRTLLVVIYYLGRWQVGGDDSAPGKQDSGAIGASAERFRQTLRQTPTFLVGLVWLLLVAASLASLIRPAWVYEKLTWHDPTSGVLELTGQGWYQTCLARGWLSTPPWWVWGMTSPSGEAMTDFQTGFILLAWLLLVRWPGTFAGWLGSKVLCWGQLLLRLLGVLAAGLFSLFAGSGEWIRPDRLAGKILLELVLPLGLVEGTANAILAGIAVLLLMLAVVALLMVLGYRLLRAGARLRQYVPFLAWRLLERKLIAFFAVGAITLCTAMVLVVYSIMGGFLDMMLTRSHDMLGDLVADSQTDTGFTGYDAFLNMLREDPQIEAATPIIYTKGLLRIGGGKRVIGVNVVGIDLPGKQAVVGFNHNLRYQKDSPHATFDPAKLPHAPLDRLETNPPIGAIVGRDTVFHRDSNGNYNYHIFPRYSEFVLSVVPLSPRGTIGEPINLKAMYVDDHLTGVYDVDSRQVYVDFSVLQKVLNMDAGRPDPETGTPGRQPRASQIQIKLKRVNGQPPDQNFIKQKQNEWQNKWDNYASEHTSLSNPWITISTWDEVNGSLIQAVRKEKFMVTTLFGGISLVSVVLVFTLLYLIAMEKSRDVGVIKAVGGSDAGVATIFVAYGAVMGLVGGCLGLVLGTLITWNINQIQDFLASLHPALRVWDPSIYVFETIPSAVNPWAALVIFLIAVFSSTLGSVVPALKAARMQPVETLRYE